ncbi:MAG: AEC family transporter [Bacteroides sp.]|nr:AEC family transporter [Prevotella sp.]MCM1407638.1 AEC family transporter [Treponema brennaborense]MCM1469212.1 AEC family transporter [Bacteroides sp.]
MLTSFCVVAKQVLILFVLMGIGFICTKKHILTESGVRCIADVLLYLVTPCVIISSFHRDFDADMLRGFGLSALGAIGVHSLSILTAHLCVHDDSDSRRRVLIFGTVFSNCGYMALPLQNALLGSSGVFFGAAYIGVFNIFNWTYGYALMNGNGKHLPLWRLCINPGVIGITAGLLFFLTPLHLPDIILQPVQYLADLNTPLPMLVLGFYLARVVPAAILKDRKLHLILFLRLAVIPCIAFALLVFAGLRGSLLASVIIAASAPAAANTAIFALKFNRDTTLATTIIAVSTIFSIITMPLVISLAMML